MGMFRLVVREHERIPVVTQRQVGERALLTQEVAVLLRACRDANRTPFVVGHRNVKFNHHCGVIQARGISVEILPKVADDDDFDRGLLLQMLACAMGFDISRLEASQLRLQDHTILQILLCWFCDELSTQCHAGLLREYVNHSDELPVIRGRWRVDLDLRRGYRDPTRISCEFDDLIADNRYNRALKAALRSASWLAAGSSSLLRQVNLLLGWFGEVGDQKVTAADIDKLPRNRLVARYGPALDMAAWLLSERAPDLHHGGKSGFAMLFDMNQLFQSCLGNVLDGCLPSGYQLRKERPRYFLSLDHAGHRRFQMKPDFCIINRGRIVAIIDAKWKRLTPASTKGTWGIQQGDMYQLHAYATAYDCPRVALWYPANEDTDDNAERPAFRFLTAGRDPAAAAVAVDWIGLFEDLRGRHWVKAIHAEVTASLKRIGISA
jgi:5-methylcytosine-specific restriction enzyme subunit McrC